MQPDHTLLLLLLLLLLLPVQLPLLSDLHHGMHDLHLECLPLQTQHQQHQQLRQHHCCLLQELHCQSGLQAHLCCCHQATLLLLLLLRAAPCRLPHQHQHHQQQVQIT
jgi:hypothetical protein